MIEQISKQKIFDVIKSIDSKIVQKIIIFDEVTSTNNEAKKLIQNGEEEGTIILALTQKTGRGRFQRIWESPKGGLYFSIILKPTVSPEKTTLLPLVGALAVSSTLRSYGLSAEIKWPNDVRVRKKKIAGILLESDAYKSHLHYVILGIGVNLNIDINVLSDEIKNKTTSLFQEHHAVDYVKFLKELLLQLDTYYLLFLNEEYETIISEWKKQSDTMNRRVKIVSSTDEIIGAAYNVDNSGFLLVITDSGEYKKIMSGDCLYFDEL